MAAIAYHASHEQFAPSQLLKLVILAQEAGFEGIHSSDHFHPWSKRQGQSGYSFSWIGAAMQATSLPFSMVCTPGQRYHPAIVAQAIATLAEMFPGRFHVELGSGEAINEMITGQEWPAKAVRNQRLLECANIIRRLLHGEEVSFSGHVKIKEARLYTLPAQLPLLYCAALSEATARWAGAWADGLLTTAGALTDTQTRVDAFRQNGGEGKPVFLQFAFSYARSTENAINGAWDQWRSNVLPREKLADLYTVEQFDAASEGISREEVLRAIPVFTSMDALHEQVKRLEQATGASRIILHNVNRLQEEFLQDYRSL
jgi:coenzyme F420-dependent glucose-6-phosphate dehydrogenase